MSEKNFTHVSKFTRVAEDDPNRCQAVHPGFQCPFRAVGDFDRDSQQWIGPKYCPRHGGRSQSTAAKAKDARMYLLGKYQERVGQMADHPRIKSLGEEVGIIRMLLEKKLNGIQDDREMMMAASGIVALTTSITTMMKTWQHIEERSGQVLDRAKMQLFVTELIEILERYIEDTEILQMIGEDINATLDNLLSGKELRDDKAA